MRIAGPMGETYKVANTHGLEPDSLITTPVLLVLTRSLRPRSTRLDLIKARLDYGVGIYNFTLRVDVVEPTTFCSRRVLRFEERVVDANFTLMRTSALTSGDPLDERLGLLGLTVKDGADLGHLASSLVLGVAGGLDGEWSLQQTDRLAGRKTEVVLAVYLPEIGPVNIDSLSELDLVLAHGWVLRRERHRKLRAVKLIRIFDDNAHGVQDEHKAGNRPLKVLPDGLLETGDLDDAVGGGDTKLVNELKDGTRRNTPPANSNQCVQARVVPAANDLLVYQLLQLALG